MDEKVKVVIFTLAYNAEKTVRRTIESVLSQSYKNFEYFIVDNGSTDKTGEIIAEYYEEERVVPLHIRLNDPTNGGVFFNMLINSTDAKYIVWLDADDEYTSDFLENMVEFAEENQLDLTACGYDMINGETNELMKRRVAEESFVVEGDLFSERFIDYRGFMMVLWAKLYSVAFLKKRENGTWKGKSSGYVAFLDAMHMHELCYKASRIGIYGKSMHRYYQYPRSLTREQIGASIKGFKAYHRVAKEYLEKYGPLSEQNIGFLHAIFMSLVEEFVGYIFLSETTFERKIELLTEVFDDCRWMELLKYKADPQFRILLRREEYVEMIKNSILEFEGADIHTEKVSALLAYLTGAKKGKEDTEKV